MDQPTLATYHSICYKSLLENVAYRVCFLQVEVEFQMDLLNSFCHIFSCCTLEKIKGSVWKKKLGLDMELIFWLFENSDFLSYVSSHNPSLFGLDLKLKFGLNLGWISDPRFKIRMNTLSHLHLSIFLSIVFLHVQYWRFGYVMEIWRSENLKFLLKTC